MPGMKKLDSQIIDSTISNHETKCDCCSTMLCLDGWVGSLLLCQLAHLFAVRLIGSLAGPLIVSLSHTHIYRETAGSALGQTSCRSLHFPNFFLSMRCYWDIFERTMWANISTISLLSSLNNSWTVKTKCETRLPASNVVSLCFCDNKAWLSGLEKES